MAGQRKWSEVQRVWFPVVPFACHSLSEDRKNAPRSNLTDAFLVSHFPGLSEWFPPVLPLDSGFHPSPARASTMRDYFPCIVPDAWDPLLYPNSSGEDIAALHARARDLLQALDARLAQKARKDGKEIRRVLLVTHAATAIALGRSLLCDASAHIGAATASLSLYTRAPGAGAAANDNANTNTAWTQKLNGSAVHLPKGPERDWAFDHVPDNVTEPGMGQGWVDEEAPVSPLPTNVDEKTAAVVNKSSL